MYVTAAPSRQPLILILLSGGIDSAVTLALAARNLKPRGILHTIAFTYKQKHIRELDSGRQLSSHYNTLHTIYELNALSAFHGLKYTDDPSVPEDGSLASLDETFGIIPPTWKPSRNLAMLSIAAAHAYTYDIQIIAGGWHAEDYPGYPDCREDFLQSAEQTIAHAIQTPVAIWAPLLSFNKHNIVRTGLELKVPFQKTWSCYTGGDSPCHTCDACTRREQAFETLGLADPLLKHPLDKYYDAQDTEPKPR